MILGSYYTRDMTRRVLSSVGLARSPSFFKALSHCSTSNGSMPSAMLFAFVAFYGSVRLGAD
jgi:hypothetical protein